MGQTARDQRPPGRTNTPAPQTQSSVGGEDICATYQVFRNPSLTNRPEFGESFPKGHVGPCKGSMSSPRLENSNNFNPELLPTPFGLQTLRNVLQDELQAKYKNDDLAHSIGKIPRRKRCRLSKQHPVAYCTWLTVFW